MTVSQLQQHITARLTAATGSDREARAMMRDIWEDVKGWSQTDVLVHLDTEVSDYIIRTFNTIADRVAAGEPLQYATGKAHFYGMTFAVTPAVLIPRPETAELVDIIVSDFGARPDLQVMDFCTGSGCIAIALSRNLPFATVYGEDVSDAALAVACENAKALKARVQFVHGDVLTLTAPDRPLYDIIVSNPPYIAEHERAAMPANVRDHEPAMALFVPDSDPLRYYTPIARYAVQALRPGGALYFEINPLYADAMRRMLSALFDDVDIRRDSYGRYRFAIARTPLPR